MEQNIFQMHPCGIKPEQKLIGKKAYSCQWTKI